MPFISDAQLAKIQGFVQKQKVRANSAKEKAQEKAGELKGTMECVGAAMAMGYLRGKREDASGVWNAPFVKFDMELLAGTTLVGLAFFDVFGKYDEDVLNAGNGILAHYGGQVARKMAKTGQFSQVAGAGHRIGMMPEFVGMNPAYVGQGRDVVAEALRRSGV